LAIKYFNLPVLLLLLFLGGCKKREEPTTSDGVPVFSVKGLANGQSFNLTAGVNNYYMFTQSNVLQNGLLTFEGKLGEQNCAGGCEPSLKIIFRNYTLQSSYEIDSVLRKANYVYFNLFDAEHWYYEVKLKQRSTGTGTPGYSWDFGNNRFSTDAEPVVLFLEDGIYPFKATTVFSSGCFSDLVQPIYLTPTRVGKHTDFTVNYINTFELLFNSIPVNNAAIVSWNFGDGNTSTGTIVKHTFAQSGVYKVCMQYVAGNDTMEYCQNVKTNDLQKCLTNYQFATRRYIDSLQFNAVTVEWTDKNGVVYSSADTTQTGNYFRVEDINSFKPNTEGKPTKMLTLSFSCTLVNGNKTIQLSDVKGKFGVAYSKP
jgi:PKD repeat protein